MSVMSGTPKIPSTTLLQNWHLLPPYVQWTFFSFIFSYFSCLKNCTSLCNWHAFSVEIQQQILQQHQRALSTLFTQGSSSTPANNINSPSSTQGIEFRRRETQKRTPRFSSPKIFSLLFDFWLIYFSILVIKKIK
jgi:hypothetical protein